MDTNVAIVIVVALVVVASLAVVLRYGRQGRLTFKLPWGITAKAEGKGQSPATTPGMNVDKMTVREGGLTASVTSGGGMDIRNTDISKDVNLSVSPPTDTPAPKA